VKERTHPIYRGQVQVDVWLINPLAYKINIRNIKKYLITMIN